MNFVVYIFVVLKISHLGYSRVLDLPEPTLLTGTWDLREKCPLDSYVIGFSTRWSETQLVGLKFYCTYPRSIHKLGSIGYEIISARKNESTYDGKWTEPAYCERGVITGFQILTSNNQSQPTIRNVALICSDETLLIQNEAAQEGHWSKPLHCAKKEAICGTEAYKNHDFGLEGVKFDCCEIPHPASVCHPKELSEHLLECANDEGALVPLTCTYSRYEGLTFSLNHHHISKTIYENLGFDLELAAAPIFRQRFERNSVAKYNISYAPEVLINDTVVAQPGSKVKVEQKHIFCGFYAIKTPFLQIHVSTHVLKNKAKTDGNLDMVGMQSDAGWVDEIVDYDSSKHGLKSESPKDAQNLQIAEILHKPISAYSKSSNAFNVTANVTHMEMKANAESDGAIASPKKLNEIVVIVEPILTNGSSESQIANLQTSAAVSIVDILRNNTNDTVTAIETQPTAASVPVKLHSQPGNDSVPVPESAVVDNELGLDIHTKLEPLDNEVVLFDDTINQSEQMAKDEPWDDIVEDSEESVESNPVPRPVDSLNSRHVMPPLASTNSPEILPKANEPEIVPIGHGPIIDFNSLTSGFTNLTNQITSEVKTFAAEANKVFDDVKDMPIVQDGKKKMDEALKTAVEMAIGYKPPPKETPPEMVASQHDASHLDSQDEGTSAAKPAGRVQKAGGLVGYVVGGVIVAVIVIVITIFIIEKRGGSKRPDSVRKDDYKDTAGTSTTSANLTSEVVDPLLKCQNVKTDDNIEITP